MVMCICNSRYEKRLMDFVYKILHSENPNTLNIIVSRNIQNGSYIISDIVKILKEQKYEFMANETEIKIPSFSGVHIIIVICNEKNIRGCIIDNVYIEDEKTYLNISEYIESHMNKQNYIKYTYKIADIKTKIIEDNKIYCVALIEQYKNNKISNSILSDFILNINFINSNISCKQINMDL